jgi:hypothetical protein
MGFTFLSADCVKRPKECGNESHTHQWLRARVNNQRKTPPE